MSNCSFLKQVNTYLATCIKDFSSCNINGKLIVPSGSILWIDEHRQRSLGYAKKSFQNEKTKNYHELFFIFSIFGESMRPEQIVCGGPNIIQKLHVILEFQTQTIIFHILGKEIDTRVRIYPKIYEFKAT